MRSVSPAIGVEAEREDDGRRLAEMPALPGALACGRTREEAVARVQALALRILAERLEHGEPPLAPREIGGNLRTLVSVEPY